MSVRVEVRPDVLAWARARSGIDDATWGERFPRYDSWWRGESAPTLKQLEDFARKTHTPIGFLFLDEPPVCPWPCQSPRWWPGKVLAGEVVSIRE